MRRIFLLAFAVLSSLFIQAQNWQQMVMNGEKDFNKIQEAFYLEWDGKEIDRGSSYKQFKRWEYRMLPRLIDGKYLPDFAKGYFIKENEKARTDNMRSSIGSWESMGPDTWTNGPNGYNPGLGRVNTIDGHPTEPNTLFVGTPGGGLWKSTNSGENWAPIFEDLPVLGVSDFYIDPQNTNKYYLLTGDAYGGHTNSVGVFVSDDAGITWTPTSLNPEVANGDRNYRMIVNPNDSDIIFVAGNRGLLRSTDGGANWTTVLDENTTDVEYKPGSTTILYASTSAGAFYRSTNSGSNWTQILPPNSGLGRTAIGVSEANPDYVYMLASASNSRFGGVYKSVNSGLTMTLQSNSPNIFGYSQTAGDDRGQGWYDLAIAVNPENAEDIYVSGIHIWNSKNGGQTWFDEFNNAQRLNYWVYNPNNTDNYVHADNHTLDFINGDLYAGCDGGVFKTSNLGQSWVDLSSSLNISQFYRLGLDVNDAERVTAGAQDNGSNVRSSTGEWTHIYGADGMEALIDYEDGNRVYASYQNGGVIRYYNNFYQDNISWPLINPEGDVRESGGWITPFVLDPDDSETIYIGLNNIWKSENRGSTWTQLSDFGSSSRQLHMVISSVDNTYMYVTSGWNAYRTTNGGASWQSITNGLPTEYMTYISVSEDDPLTVYATFSGYSEGQKVYRSTNGGTTWENISNGLPNIPANTVVHQKGSSTIYVGTDVGVYMKDGESRWTTWFDGLPNVEVTELEIHYGAQKIRAATFGRGIWERDIPESLRINGVTADVTEILENESVNFSVSYDGTPEGFNWSFPGGTPESSSDESPTVTYNEAGEYNVVLQLEGGNEPTVFLEGYIKVETLIQVNELSVSTTTPRMFENVLFDVLHDGEADTQSWTFEGGSPETSTDRNPLITYEQAGTFDVSVTVNGRNSDSRTFEDFITVLQPLGLDNEQIRLNPTVITQNVKIEVAESNTHIEIIDLAGRIVFSTRTNSGITELDFSNLQKGLYTIRLIDSKGERVTKVVKK